jgi:hypothetical protein
MAFIEVVFQILVLITFPVSLIMMIKLVITTHKIRQKQQRYIKNIYPDLKKTDLNYRQIKLAIYQRVYLNSRLKNILQIISLFGMLVGMIGALFVAFLTESVIMSFLLISLTYYLGAYFLLSQPSAKEQYDFWNEYLEKYPDNPLKVVLTSFELAEKVVNNTKKVGILLAVLATDIWVFGLYSLYIM